MSATLQRKVQKVLSSKARFDTPDMIAATQGLSALYAPGDNTLDNRRKLRSLLDRRSVHIHHQLVASFHTVNQSITQLHATLTQLVAQCEATLQSLQHTKTNNTQLLTQTQALQAEQAAVNHRLELTTHFLSKFQLSDADVAALEGSLGGLGSDDASDGGDGGGLDEAFFVALGRIGRIREDCKQLLQSYHQRIGLDILDSLAKRLESGYERLYRYVQSQASQLTTLPADSSAPVVSALALLRSMPVYYDHCCGEIAQAHRLAVIQRFMAAMSRGEGGARPIDVHAHDAVRYVSELLRWVEQAIRSEKEFIDQLMAMIDQQQALLTSATPAPATAPVTTNSASTSSSPPAMLASIFEGLARLLRTRIEQALLTQPTPDTSFRLYTLLSSASLPLLSLLPPDAVLSATVRSLIDTARINFFDTVKRQGDKLSAHGRLTPPSDLSPPPVLVEALTQLNSILSAASAASTSVEMAPVLAALLDPLLGALSASAAQLPADEQAVYAINCLHAVLSVLRRYEAARGRAEMSALELDAEAEKLVGVQYDAVMERCAMKPVVERLRAARQQRKQPLSAEAGLGEAAVRQAVGAFYAQLFSVGSFVVPQADRLLQSALRRSCRESVALSISAAYREVWECVTDPREGYGAGSGGGMTGGVRWLQHTPDQVDLLLEVRKESGSGGTLNTPISSQRASSSIVQPR